MDLDEIERREEMAEEERQVMAEEAEWATMGEDPFYDSRADDKDEEWVKKHVPTGRLGKTDAILNCPGCFAELSRDTQRHERYKTQYRAMFVTNCSVVPNVKFQDVTVDGKSRRDVVGNQGDRRSIADCDDDDDICRPVLCSICGTEVGAYEEADELYHFFHVYASY